jgi:uncharacterized cupin superfamily protein
MKKVTRISKSDIPNGVEGRIPAAILLEGDPVTTTWQVDSGAPQVGMGIWRSEPGKNISRKNGVHEFCYIVEGVVELTDEDGTKELYRKGDCFVMKSGFSGTWETIETVEKFFVTVDVSN